MELLARRVYHSEGNDKLDKARTEMFVLIRLFLFYG